MNIPNEAFLKAKAGGWECPAYYLKGDRMNAACGEYSVPMAVVILDPSFWQSLGKALGWLTAYKEHEEGATCWCQPINKASHGSIISVHRDWTPKGKCHEFLDCLWGRASAEEFWKELLAKM